MVKVAEKLNRKPESILFESEKFYSLSVLQQHVKNILEDPADFDLHVNYGERFKVEAIYHSELFVSGSWVMINLYACDIEISTEHKFIRVKDMNILDDDEIEEGIINSLSDLVEKNRHKIECILSDIYDEKVAEDKALQDTEDFINVNLYRW